MENTSEERNDVVAVTTHDVEERMIILRKQPVLIDADVADLYGVETKRINEAVRNNPKKFPCGYIFELDRFEKKEVVEKIVHLNKLKFSKVQPVAFTERGLYMLATILKSERAIDTTLAIVDTFVRATPSSQTGTTPASTTSGTRSIREIFLKETDYERNCTCRRVRHEALSDYKGGEQAAFAHLRQADGVLSHQRADVGRD